MAVSISNAFPASPALSLQGGPKSEAPVAKAAPVATDTVKLSQSAQIHALKQQGQGASQIAKFLGVSVASVDGVLGITVAKAAVAAAPAPDTDAKTAGASAPAASAAPAAPAAVQAVPISAPAGSVAKG